MKFKILLVLLLTSGMCYSQTKIIAHKSHSGSKSTFSKAYKSSLFDLNSSNFGLPGDRKVIVLDSVIVINESMTLLKFRESKSCHPFGTNFQSLKASDLKLRTDTLLSHEVLNGSNTVAGARAYLEDHYNYFGSNSSPERIVLIGFKE